MASYIQQIRDRYERERMTERKALLTRLRVLTAMAQYRRAGVTMTIDGRNELDNYQHVCASLDRKMDSWREWLPPKAA